ncbi:MAG: carboxylate--amine ligase, partial [Tepidisphaeraceae bacterium]
RYAQPLHAPGPGTLEERWARLLLSDEVAPLHDAVGLAWGDIGIRVLAWNRPALLERYQLADSDPNAQLALLDKLTTYKLARQAGTPTPNFWEITSRQQLLEARPEMNFPLMFKPRISHVFEAKLGRKHVIVDDFDALLRVWDQLADTGLEVLLMEMIPGPDSQLASYYTYLDAQSRPQFHFTKRIIRRFPTNMGSATYHITDHVPELHELANRLFKHVGLQGLANIEFKLDARDNTWKVIECNCRFTAANVLATASGCQLSVWVYSHIVGLPLPDMSRFRDGLTLWDPVRDFWAFCELRRMKQITLLQWLRSLPRHPILPFFTLRDPLPAIMRTLKPLRRKYRTLLGTPSAVGGDL